MPPVPHAAFHGAHDVWFAAALIAIWAYRSFHRPYAPEAVRYATEPGRYVVGLFAFVAAVFALYVALTVLVIAATGVLQGGKSFFEQSWLTDWIPAIDALLAALLLVVFLPVTRLAHALRRCTWLLAGFPRAAEDVAGALTLVAEVLDDPAMATVSAELQHYEVTAEDVGARLSTRVQALLCEVQMIHDKLEALAMRTPGAVRLGARFDGFVGARRKVISRLDLEHARLMRRTARAVLFARYQGIERRDAYPLSDLLGEEALRLLADYRLLVAEASLSSVTRHGRSRLLRAFGYASPDLAHVPVWPVAAVFVLDAVMFLLFPAELALLTWAGVLKPSETMPPTPPGAALLAVVTLHGLGQAMAVAWAIYPKSISNFARPGIRSLPIGSYALFGFGSYCTGVAISWTAFRLLPGKLMTFGTFVFGGSVFFAVVTVVLSCLIDWRLREGGPTSRLFSVRDGVLTAAACLGFDAAFRFAVHHLLHEPFPDWKVALLIGPLGFVLGSFVPGVAYAYLARDRTLDQGELGPRSSSGLPQEAGLHEVAT